MQVEEKTTSRAASVHQFKGLHLLATYCDCDRAVLLDVQICLEALTAAAKAAGSKVVGNSAHAFPNGGVTVVLLLAESHASIHTYPECGSCFVDFFSCGVASVEAFDACLRQRLQCGSAQLSVIERT